MSISNKLGALFQKIRRLSFLSLSFWWPPAALISVAAFWFLFSNEIPLPKEKTAENYGMYGDSFGRLTSLFTALGFGGLIITLLLQQRQIRIQEDTVKRNRLKEEKERYEEILFRLLEMYRQTLSEVRVGSETGRTVLRNAIGRAEACIIEEGVNGIPRDLQGKWDSGTLTDADRQRIDYLHFRNFKIVATEINPQARLVDTFEVLLDHMVRGMPEHLLITAYEHLVFAQITYIECRYFFLVSLSHPSRSRLRYLLSKSGFFSRISRSQIHRIHRNMYEEYWGLTLIERAAQPSIPMSQGRIKRAIRAHKNAGGIAYTTYTPLAVRCPNNQAVHANKSRPNKNDTNE